MLRVLSIEDMEPIRQWRNQCLSTLRTPFPLTKEQQEQWYRDEICNRASRSRFWGIEENGELVGYGGVENIQWENRIGEISLLINPAKHGRGYGMKAAQEIISQAFTSLNLHTVYAECYENNIARTFWDKVFINGYRTMLPNRKYANASYVGSLYYSLSQPW